MRCRVVGAILQPSLLTSGASVFTSYSPFSSIIPLQRRRNAPEDRLSGPTADEDLHGSSRVWSDAISRMEFKGFAEHRRVHWSYQSQEIHRIGAQIRFTAPPVRDDLRGIAAQSGFESPFKMERKPQESPRSWP